MTEVWNTTTPILTGQELLDSYLPARIPGTIDEFGQAQVQSIVDAASGSGGGALPQLQPVIEILDNGIVDAEIVLLGDSTGDTAAEWFYLLGQQLAVDYPAVTVLHRSWDTATNAYLAATTLQTGTGARTLTLFNGSVAGTAANYHAGDTFVAAVPETADLAFLSYGHNGGPQAARQLDFFNAIGDRLQKDRPNIPVVVIGQNPTRSDETMAAKLVYIQAFASHFGFGFINVHAAFIQSGQTRVELTGDEVHPNAAGSLLWKNTVHAAFVASRTANRQASVQDSRLLRSWHGIADYSEFTKANITLSKNTALFETLGYSVKLASAASGLSYLTGNVISGDDIVSLRGQWVTLAILVNVPIGNASTSGRIDLTDVGGSGVTTQGTGVRLSNGFVLHTVRKFIADGTTELRAEIWANAAATIQEISINWMSLATGQFAVTPFPDRSIFTRHVRINGSSPAGIMSFSNTFTSGAGIRGSLADGDDPLTEYTVNFCADGFEWKNKTDTHVRYSIGSGGIKMGGGSSTPNMAIDRQLDGIFRVTGGGWWPAANGTQYIGDTTKPWRALYVKDGVYVNGILCLGPQGAAIANPTGGATVDAEARTAITAILTALRAGSSKIAP